jgi:hypothetical protein
MKRTFKIYLIATLGLLCCNGLQINVNAKWWK